MKSNNKLTILLMLGALLTGGASWYLTQNYIDTQVSDYKSNFDEEREAISVVVANRNLSVGDVLSAANASIRQVPKAYVHKDAILPSRFGAVEGRQILHPVKAGETILNVHVNSMKVDGLASLLESGQRAITLPVDSADTFSGFLRPGDWIDLYITLRDGERDRTVPLIEDVRVLATGGDIDDGIASEDPSYSEITIGVSPADATRLIHGQSVGDISVLLRKSEDEESTYEDYVTIDNLIDIPQNVAPAPQRHTGWGFELIKGGTRS